MWNFQKSVWKFGRTRECDMISSGATKSNFWSWWILIAGNWPVSVHWSTDEARKHVHVSAHESAKEQSHKLAA